MTDVVKAREDDPVAYLIKKLSAQKIYIYIYIYDVVRENYKL